MDDSKIIIRLDKLQEDVSEIRSNVAVINDRCKTHQDRTESLETIQHGRPGNGGSPGQGSRLDKVEGMTNEHEDVIKSVQLLPWKIASIVIGGVILTAVLFWLGLKG
jgi:hypothetical protein